MKYSNINNNPDVIILYQERDSVIPAIEQIKDLKLKFSTYQFSQDNLRDIAKLKPKILLLSSNDVKKTIREYVTYLDKYEKNISPHAAILLIKNRESSYGYLACENGLFDNYVIINPFNEPHRLKLILLKELKLIENHKNEDVEQLMSEGEGEFASCIEHGVALKKSFVNEVNECQSNLLSTMNQVIDDDGVIAVLENLITLSLKEMNGNISKITQNTIDQLITLKKNNQIMRQHIAVALAPPKKTIVGVNTTLLTSSDEKGQNPTLSHKVLIAEPSGIFSRVVDDIFSETVFKHLLVHDGKAVLDQVTAFNPDVILMAYDLPKLNGIDVTKVLRKDGNNVPIIAYTHHHDKSMIKSWIQLGLSGYLIKPSKKSLILKSLAEALEQPIDIIYHPKNAGVGQIKWISEYSVGNKKMDEQHKVLFRIINKFFKVETKELAIETFEKLSSYIGMHFEEEEYLLRQINYPKVAEHIKKHDKLKTKFHLLQQKLENHNIDLHHKIALFLYNWLASHILKADMDYKSYALSIEETSFSPFDSKTTKLPASTISHD